MDISLNETGIYNGIVATSQSVYDAYNSFIFANDSRVFNKMIKRSELYLCVKGLVGDILEFGVFSPLITDTLLTFLISIMVSHVESSKHRCQKEKNVSTAFILPNRWQHRAQSLVISLSMCLL